MLPHPPRCSVIMVHYGDPRVTQKALVALWAGVQPPARVIIIDHAERPLVLLPRPQQDVIRPATNAGYAGGLNIGLGMIFASRPHGRDIVVGMNNDVFVSAASLHVLVEHLWQHTEPVFIGARWGVVNPLTGRSALRPTGSSERPSPTTLPYIDGAFLAAPWLAWWKLQKVPDDYFMYWEDSALYNRIRQLNIRVQVLPNLRLEHADTTTSAPVDWHTYYLVRNGAHYMQTSTSWPIRGWWRLYNPMRYLYHVVHGGPQSRLIRRALGDALRGVRGKQDVP